MPDYYGTGRQPKAKKSYVGLAVTLIVVLLAANALPFVISYLRQFRESPERSAMPEQRNLTLPHDEDAPPQQTAVCGMLLCELDDVQQRYWNLPNGVIVGQVEENGTAAHAGILPGDVIVRIGDAAPATADECLALLTACADGDRVQIGLYRSGEELQIELIYRAEE